MEQTLVTTAASAKSRTPAKATSASVQRASQEIPAVRQEKLAIRVNNGTSNPV